MMKELTKTELIKELQEELIPYEKYILQMDHGGIHLIIPCNHR